MATNATQAASERRFAHFQKLLSKIDHSKAENAREAVVLSAMNSLIAHAFGAYKTPKEKTIIERTSLNTTVQYLNHDVNDEAIAGVVKITLEKVTDVPRSDYGPGSSSDPYVTFSLGNSRSRSETKQNTLNPEWQNSTHLLIIRKRYIQSQTGPEKIRVSLFDDDSSASATSWTPLSRSLNKDDKIASVELKLEDILQEDIQSHNLPMVTTRKTTETPVITFTTEYLSFRDAFEQERISQTICSSERELSSLGAISSSLGLRLVRPFDVKRSKFKPYAFIESPDTDTQAWVYVCRSKKTLVVAFRGTEIGKWKDLATDIKARKKSITSIHNSPCNDVLEPTEKLKDRHIKVHRGFLKAYQSIRHAILQVVYDITQWREEWSIDATGHSLGGALATLCAFEIANRKNHMGKSPSIGMMSYGAPRVGNRTFAKHCQETVDDCYRVIDRYDMVHMVPPFYTHTGTEILCTSSGNVYMDGRLVNIPRSDTAPRVESSEVVPGKTTQKRAVWRKYRFGVRKIAERHRDQNYLRITQNDLVDAWKALRLSGRRSEA